MRNMTEHLGLVGAISQVAWPPGVSHRPLMCFVMFFGPQTMFSVVVFFFFFFNFTMPGLSCGTLDL